jgi:hypothetical protein
MAWPAHCSRLNLITSDISSSLCSCFNSSFLLVLHRPCSFTGPNIRRRIFLPKESITLAAVCERVQVSPPYSNVGRITVLCIRILVLVRTSLHFRIDCIEKKCFISHLNPSLHFCHLIVICCYAYVSINKVIYKLKLLIFNRYMLLSIW